MRLYHKKNKQSQFNDIQTSQKKQSITINNLENLSFNHKEIQSSLSRFASDFKPIGKGIDSIRFNYSKAHAKKAYSIAQKHKFTKCDKGVFSKRGIYLKIDKKGIELYNLKQFNQSKKREYRELSQSQREAVRELVCRLPLREVDFAVDIETKNKPQTLAKRVSRAQYIKAPKGHKRILFSKDYTITKHHSTRYLKPRTAKNGNCIKQVCIYDKRAKNNLAFNCVRVEYTISANTLQSQREAQSVKRMRVCFEVENKVFESVDFSLREQYAPP